MVKTFGESFDEKFKVLLDLPNHSYYNYYIQNKTKRRCIMLGFKKCMGKLAKLSLSLVICAAVLMSGVATLSASAETDNAGLSQTQFLTLAIFRICAVT